MLADFDRWEEILGGLKGKFLRGTERIAACRILDLLGADEVLGQRVKVGKKIAPIMRKNGWHGPCSLRCPDDSAPGGFLATTGYWRVKDALPRPVVEGETPVDLPEGVGLDLGLELPEALADGATLGVRWSRVVLRKRVDTDNAALLRAQGQAAALMVTSQLRADESRLKRQRDNDVLDRLERLLRRVEREIPLEPGYEATCRALASQREGEVPSDIGTAGAEPPAAIAGSGEEPGAVADESGRQGKGPPMAVGG